MKIKTRVLYRRIQKPIQSERRFDIRVFSGKYRFPFSRSSVLTMESHIFFPYFPSSGTCRSMEMRELLHFSLELIHPMENEFAANETFEAYLPVLSRNCARKRKKNIWYRKRKKKKGENLRHVIAGDDDESSCKHVTTRVFRKILEIQCTPINFIAILSPYYYYCYWYYYYY